MAISFRRAALLACPALVLWALGHLPSWGTPHREGDELVYKALAVQLAKGRGHTLQGSALLSELDTAMYDKPLFHHPPLVPILLIPFRGQMDHGVVWSWLAHLLALLAVMDLARRHLRGPRGELALACALVLAALDPVLLFTSNKIWLDAPVAALAAASVAAFDRGLARGTMRAMVPAAVLFALAGWTKLVGLLAVAPLAVLAADHARRGPVARPLVAFAALSSALLAPWFLWFVAVFGRPLPTWVKPSETFIATSEFIRLELARPPHHYFSELAQINPLMPLLLLLAPWAWPRLKHGGLYLACWAWLLGTLGAFTALGATGHTYQTRFAALASPPLYVLAALSLAALPRRVLPIGLAAAVACGAVCAALDREILSHPERSMLGSLRRY